MSDISLTFRKLFTRAYESSSFTSYRQLSLSADCSEPLVQQIIKGKFDGSRAGPGVFTLYRLACTLGLSIDSLLQSDLVPPQRDLSVFNDIKGRDPASFDTLMSTHWRGGGRLDAFDHVEDHFDLYAAPDDSENTPQIRRLGHRSLLAMRLETVDRVVAQRELDLLPEKTKSFTMSFHKQVMTQGICCDNTFLDHKLSTKPVHVRAGYSRLGLRVESPKGEALILIACKPIPV